MLCIFLHSRVCWSSWSTASWRHMAELSWTVLKKEVFTENTIQLVRKSRWGIIMMVALHLKVCDSTLSTASWRHLEGISWIVPKRKVLVWKILSSWSQKLVRYRYYSSNNPEGVLEQLVNCFLETMGGCPAFRQKDESKTSSGWLQGDVQIDYL